MIYLSILWTFFRSSILNELTYRTNFWARVFEAGVDLLAAVTGLFVVFGHTETLGGWHLAELQTLVGLFLMVGGLIQLVIYPSMQHFIEDVSRGTLDFVLTKPADAQFLISVRDVHIWRLVDILLGGGMVIAGLARLEIENTIWNAVTFGIAFVAGMVIVYSFWVILATTAFWFVRVEILLLFQSLYEAGRWPISIYPAWLRVALTFIVPVAFAVTVPAEAVLDRLTPQALLTAGALAIAMLVGSRVFWKVGIRHYTGASA